MSRWCTLVELAEQSCILCPVLVIYPNSRPRSGFVFRTWGERDPEGGVSPEIALSGDHVLSTHMQFGGFRPFSTLRLITPDCPFYPSVYFPNRMPVDPLLSTIKTVSWLSEKFDQLAFRKYMHDFGRAYHNQAMELIAICRLFSQVAQQVFTQDAELTR